MTNNIPHYATLVVFGREHARSVSSPELFREIVRSLASFVALSGYQLKCRGYVMNTQGRNVAPRKSRFTDRAVDNWQSALGQGRFMSFELFDEAWSDIHFPVQYAHLEKLWSYSSEGYIETTKNGAENAVTVAMRREFLANRLLPLERYAETLTRTLSGFYGYIENDVEWDREIIKGLHEDAINYRTNRAARDCKGAYTMSTMIPRLYWGNILSRAHFLDGNPGSLPSWAVAHTEMWGNDIYYVRFVRDPQEDSTFHKAIAPFFNIIP